MSSWKDSSVWPMISIVLVTFVGNGFIWEYKKINIENAKISLDKERISIDKERLSIETMKMDQEKNKSAIDIAKQKYEYALLEIEKDKRSTEAEKLLLEKHKIAIDKERHDIEKIKESTLLRERRGELLLRVIAITEEYLQVNNERRANINPDGSIINLDRDSYLNNSMGRLRAKLDNYKQEFMTIENNLAKIEGRPPERVNLNFVPPAPPAINSIRIN